jgi:hypothetical protein
MGRTTPTYRCILEAIIGEWKGFRKALRSEDRKAFDRLMIKARKHASAASYEARLDTTEAIFMSMILEIEKELEAIKKSIREKR